MKLYRVEQSTNLEQVGDFPQVQGVLPGYDLANAGSCSQIARYFFGKKPNISIDFDCLVLSKKGKLTDYLSCSFLNELAGLLVSQKLFLFLSHLKLIEFVKFDASVYERDLKSKHPYVWIHYTHEYPEFVDFKRSQFFLDHPEANFRSLKIGSYSEYVEKQKSSRYKINSKSLILNKEVVSKFDIIRIGFLNNQTFINERSMEGLTEKGFTGISYEVAEDLIIM